MAKGFAVAGAEYNITHKDGSRVLREKICFLPLVIGAFLLIALGGDGAGGFPLPGFGKRTAKWLRVRGRAIVDEDGKEFQITGLLLRPVPVGAGGISGGDQEYQVGMLPLWGRPYDFALSARRAGFNTIVIEPEGPRENSHIHYPIERSPGGKKPFRVRRHWMPYPWMRSAEPREFVDKWLVPVVKEIEEAGMYVIIDLHMGRWDIEGMYRWGLPFWKAVAQTFKDDPYIACYIPYCETIVWPKEAEEKDCGYFETRTALMDALRRWYMDVIEAIRRQGDRHIIILSNWHGGYVPEAHIDLWKCVNLRPDLPHNQVAFKMEVVWGPVIERYETAKSISTEYGVPIFITHMEMGGTWEDRAIGYDRLLRDPDSVGFFISPHYSTKITLAHQRLYRKLLEEKGSPPPPPRKSKHGKLLFELTADDAEGGEKVLLIGEGDTIPGVRVGTGGEPRSAYRFSLPRKLKPGTYEIEVSVFSNPEKSARQVVWWIDSDGEVVRNRSFGWGSGFEGFDWRYHNSVPVYVQGDGWHLHRFLMPAYSQVSGLVVERLGGTLPTRPIGHIRIRRPLKKNSR